MDTDRIGDAFDAWSLDAGTSDARAAWRADEHEWTLAALERWRHERTLLDRARDHMHRGDTIAVTLPGLTAPSAFTGWVIGVGSDVFTLASIGGRVDVHAPGSSQLAWRVVRHATAGGTRGVGVGSFRARLLELEMRGEPVEVGAVPLDGGRRGTLTVGRDHLMLDDPDGGSAVVALAAVQWVRPADEA